VVSPGPSLALYSAAAAVGLLGLWARKPLVFAAGKPVVTVLLFAVFGGLPGDQRGFLLAGGIALSLVADIALLADGRAASVTGLLLFVPVQFCYGLAFWAARAQGWLLAPGVVIFGAGSLWLLRFQGRKLGPDLRLLTAMHGLAMTLMVATVYSTLAGRVALRLALLASAGATLFYLSQAFLPWVRLRRVSLWAQSATLVTYWAGQLCLVLAARWGLGEKLVP
jgi:uncharacterized membrane protein YhhN